MEYKEIVKKDGSKLIFCNFEDLLKEYYGVSSMDEVKTHVNSNGEYIIHCPFCKAEGHSKHKLYIREDLSVGYCFVCCRKYINVDDNVDVEVKVPDFLPGMFHKPFNLVRLEDPEWSLDRFKFEFDEFDQRGYDYLIGRHKYMADLYKILGFKFIDGNIAMPFFYKGEPFYYQIRFTGNSKIRYYFPPVSAKSPYVIERGEPYKHKIMIVEGIFDAIAVLIQAPEYTPVAVLGSNISDYQIDYIRDVCDYLDEIRIWMDETKISIRIANKIKRVIDYCPISIIKSKGQDPEETMKERIKLGLPLQWIKSKIK